MPRYRKLPVEVDAITAQDALAYAANEWASLPEWLREAYDRTEVLFGNGYVSMRTGHGQDWATAGADDWIVRGVQGELYPCRPDIFAATYEAI